MISHNNPNIKNVWRLETEAFKPRRKMTETEQWLVEIRCYSNRNGM